MAGQNVEVTFKTAAGVRKVVSETDPLPTTGSGGGSGGAVAGDVANDSADSGNPVKIGGKASNATPTAVTNGDRVNAYFDLNGRLHVVVDSANMTYKILADGQLAASKGTLYTVPASTVAHVRFIRALTTGASQTVKLYVKKAAGTSRQIAQAVLAAAGEFLDAISDGQVIELGAGDLIEGESTGATTVDYVITGSEEV